MPPGFRRFCPAVEILGSEFALTIFRCLLSILDDPGLAGFLTPGSLDLAAPRPTDLDFLTEGGANAVLCWFLVEFDWDGLLKLAFGGGAFD